MKFLGWNRSDRIRNAFATMPPKQVDFYKRPFFKMSLEKHEIQVRHLDSRPALCTVQESSSCTQEDIALIENLAGIKRRTQAPARFGTQDVYRRNYNNDD